jgi:polyisoprenoid-binding protein YceI
MKKNIINRIATLFVAAMVTIGLRASAADSKAPVVGNKGTIYKVLVDQSEVKWTGKKVTGMHTGTIQLKSGEIMTLGAIPTGGSFVIDMSTIKDADLTDPGYNAKLVGDLKSDNFFGVDKNPTSTFEITDLSAIAHPKPGEPNYNIKGDLTIKGVTHPVSFAALITMDGDMLKATAKGIKVDRTLYNIRYGSKKFFKSIGDKAISDEFLLDVALVAKKK